MAGRGCQFTGELRAAVAPGATVTAHLTKHLTELIGRDVVLRSARTGS